MKTKWWQLRLGMLLVAASAILYYIHYLIFHDAHHIFIYMLGDIAFVPIEVLLVTLILHRLLETRERQALLHKMNMVVGAFFSEVGRPLIERIAEFDRDTSDLQVAVSFKVDWTKRDFEAAHVRLSKYDYSVDAAAGDLVELNAFLREQRRFVLGLLQNPNLLEHESFTELLWAVSHLGEELDARRDLTDLEATDLEHLAGDIKRAYHALLGEWLRYLRHLSEAYPYLYSLAVRTNPFDETARAEV